ncbi:hypothetical protein POM88_040520 [Heracleum sosnowskyi]|uniref:Uncharacterized protein n=1 Tax=Heracleum sosnowskyi TaxID=360622 RepID=A0AAD8HD44_9APIA|nr:hypothetical protein POM88_040520 [Heracleum sosnowskyi]
MLSTITNIGPTLRAVASMKKYDWILIFEDWKDEFHFICGIYLPKYELIFLAVKITLRLLVKTCRGKSLSKRERQLLTQAQLIYSCFFLFFMYIFVPLIEFMWPVFLKLFTSMLPPTSQDKMKEEALKRKDYLNDWRKTSLILTSIFFLASAIWFIGIFLHSVDRFNEDNVDNIVSSTWELK